MAVFLRAGLPHRVVAHGGLWSAFYSHLYGLYTRTVGTAATGQTGLTLWAECEGLYTHTLCGRECEGSTHTPLITLNHTRTAIWYPAGSSSDPPIPIAGGTSRC